MYVIWQLFSTIENNDSMVLIIRHAKSYKCDMNHMVMDQQLPHLPSSREEEAAK